MMPAPRTVGPRKPERQPHALPVWSLEVEDDERDPDSLALAFVGAAAIGVLFVIVFVLLPA